MNDQFTNQAKEFFESARDARIPENVQTMAEDGVTRTREVYQRVNAVAQDSAKVMEEIMLANHAGAKTISEKVLSNTAANTEAVFEAAQAIARARSLPEAGRLQADFFQQQMQIAGAQSKELMELSTKVARQTFETINAATAKSFETVRKS